MLRHIMSAAATGAIIATCALSAHAAPIGNLGGEAASAGSRSALENVAYRRCWYRYGVRHCRWVGSYYGDDDYPYYGYGYGPYYGPGLGFFFGGGGGHGGHFRGGHHHRTASPRSGNPV